MKPESVACFLAAALVHALILFGFQVKTSPAHPLAISEETAPAVNVNLVESAPEPMPPPVAAQVPAAEPSHPPQAPLSAPPQSEVPTAAAVTAPTPEEMSESTPAASPRKQALRLREVRYPAAHTTAAGSAATLFSHTAGHNLPSNGIETSLARYLNNPKPEYPEIARQLRQQGVAILAVEVGADGHPNQVSLSRSSGFPLLDHAAIQAVRAWSFRPERAGDVPVSSHVEVPIRFSLAD